MTINKATLLKNLEPCEETNENNAKNRSIDENNKKEINERKNSN